MMPAWHQRVPMSRHLEESETARKLQLYASSSSRFILLFVNSTIITYHMSQDLDQYPMVTNVHSASEYSIVSIITAVAHFTVF